MKILEGLHPETFELTPNNFSIKNNTLIVTKKNWDYQLAHAFQEEMIERVYNNKNENVFIFCNHPSCLTLGKGLQRTKDEAISLIDFDPNIEDKLDIEVHKIKRGGGITFHHTNQFVFYPIISLENKKLRVFDFLLLILNLTKESLQEITTLDKLRVRTDLLGLWSGEVKIASIGLSAKRFVSYHGLALNLDGDEKIEKALMQIFPCGLPGDFYSHLHREAGENVSFEEVQNSLERKLSQIIS